MKIDNHEMKRTKKMQLVSLILLKNPFEKKAFKRLFFVVLQFSSNNFTLYSLAEFFQTHVLCIH